MWLLRTLKNLKNRLLRLAMIIVIVLFSFGGILALILLQDQSQRVITGVALWALFSLVLAIAPLCFWLPKMTRIEDFEKLKDRKEKKKRRLDQRKDAVQKVHFPQTCEGCDDELAYCVGEENVEKTLAILSEAKGGHATKEDKRAAVRKLLELSNRNVGEAIIEYLGDSKDKDEFKEILGDSPEELLPDKNNTDGKRMSSRCIRRLEVHFGIGRRSKRTNERRYWEFMTKSQITDHLLGEGRLHLPDANVEVSRRGEYLPALLSLIAIATNLAWGLFSALTVSLSSPPFCFTAWGVGIWLVFFGAFVFGAYSEGGVEIEEKHVGVFKLFGTRYPIYCTQEGKQFTFPPLFEMKTVNTKVKRMRIVGARGEEGSGQEEKKMMLLTTQDKNRVRLNVFLVYRVFSPYKYLELDEPEKTLDGEAASILRSTAATNELDYLTVSPLKIMREIAKRFGSDDTTIEEDWGFQILNIQVQDVTPTEELEKARERKKIEQEEKQAVDVEIEALGEQAVKLFNILEDAGFDTSNLDAKDFVKIIEAVKEKGVLEIKDVNFKGDLTGANGVKDIIESLTSR